MVDESLYCKVPEVLFFFFSNNIINKKGIERERAKIHLLCAGRRPSRGENRYLGAHPTCNEQASIRYCEPRN